MPDFDALTLERSGASCPSPHYLLGPRRSPSTTAPHRDGTHPRACSLSFAREHRHGDKKNISGDFMVADKWMKTLVCLLAISFLGLMPLTVLAQELPEQVPEPERVLIFARHQPDDDRLLTLAGAFSARAIVRVVAPSFEKNESYLYEDSSGLPGTIRTRQVFELGNITAYEVHGGAARWMHFTLDGLLRDSPPDLVIAGFDDPPVDPHGSARWAESAAAVAAEFGIPALAIVPPRSVEPESLIEMARWLVSLSRHPWLSELTSPGYLRVQFPRHGLSQPWEIRIGVPAETWPPAAFKPLWKEANGGWRIWTCGPTPRAAFLEEGLRSAKESRYCIFLTPMRVSRPDEMLIESWNISPSNHPVPPLPP